MRAAAGTGKNGEDEKLRKKLEDFYALLEDFRQQAAFTPIP